jgi:hypothetical protein
LFYENVQKERERELIDNQNLNLKIKIQIRILISVYKLYHSTKILSENKRDRVKNISIIDSLCGKKNRFFFKSSFILNFKQKDSLFCFNLKVQILIYFSLLLNNYAII